MASVSKISLISAQALTAATTNADPVSMGPRSGRFVAFFKATAVNAATTVNAKIQHSPNNGTDWFDVVSFTALVNVAGSELKYHKQFTSEYQGILPRLRAVVTLAGVTKAATVTVELWFDDVK